MAILGIRGDENRCDEIMDILKTLGGKDSGNWSGSDSNNIYYINPNTGLIDARSLVTFSNHDIEELKKFYKVTYEEFCKEFQYKIGQKVHVLRQDGSGFERSCIGTIEAMIWDKDTDEVLYDIGFGSDHGYYEVRQIYCCLSQKNVDSGYTLKTDTYTLSTQVVEVHPETEIEVKFDPEQYNIVIRNGRLFIVKQ